MYKILVLVLISVIIFSCKKDEVINNILDNGSNETLSINGDEIEEFVIFDNSINVINENNKIIDNNIFEIKYIQEDYDRDDLLLIMGFGSVTFKISSEELEKQEKLTFYELINSIKVIDFINISSYFINDYFEKRYVGRTYFHSVEYITVNDKKYGNNKDRKRNDWIIQLTYKFHENDNMKNEMVVMLPDYRIIISSNNFENVIIK